jgi:hypothetical protein
MHHQSLRWLLSFIGFRVLEVSTVIKMLVRLEHDVIHATSQRELHSLNGAETDNALAAGQVASHLLMHKIIDMQETVNRS